MLKPGPFPQRAEAGPPRPGQARVRGAAILYVHSIQSWSELEFPDRRVRVVLEKPPGGQLAPALADWVRRRGGPREPEPDEVVIVLPAAGLRIPSP